MKARELLREKYKTADIGISGANFLIADTGSIAITENEGNARLTTAFPKFILLSSVLKKSSHRSMTLIYFGHYLLLMEQVKI